MSSLDIAVVRLEEQMNVVKKDITTIKDEVRGLRQEVVDLKTALARNIGIAVGALSVIQFLLGKL